MTLAAIDALALAGPPVAPSGVEIDAPTLDACVDGDAAAIRRFVVRYEHLVFAFVSRSLGRGPHVEDLAQEVFLRACRALSTFDPRGPARPSTWLLRIASRVVIDARRRRTVPTTGLDELGPREASCGGTPESDHARAELGSALEAAAASLPAEQRDVFVLADLHGLATAEVASVLGVREGTVRTRLFRARARLRALLRDAWEDT